MSADESDFVEGYNDLGKQLERVPASQLRELHADTQKKKNEIDNELQNETDLLTKKQNELNGVNENFLKKKEEKMSLELKKEVNLGADRQKLISDITKNTLDTYLEKRPTQNDEQRSVHVYFLSGEECGSELHIGQEGAGSKDATFIVRLSQTVDSLAKQAAKYWGLDPNKVFFLDRDGRIVQGKMSLKDIILPPLETDPNANASKEGAGTGLEPISISGGATSSTALAVRQGGEGEQLVPSFTLKGKDYSLTLVRAKTVLSKEDLGQPKGEKWHDFTFDQKRLNEDLEKTRKNRGDPDPKQDKVSMENIPSLYGLIKKGQERKFKKVVDKWCRLTELFIFLLMVFFFIFVLNPENSWTYHMNMVGQAIQREALTFNHMEQAALGVKSFNEIIETAQYEAWLQGPLQRAILPGGLDSMNLYPMKVQGRIYKSPETVAADLNWCPDPHTTTPAPSTGDETNTTTVTTTTATTTTASTTTNTTTITTTTTTSTTTTSTTSITTTNTTLGTTITHTTTTTNETSTTTTTVTTTTTTTALCYPSSLKQCPTVDVVELLSLAIRMNQTVPECKARYDLDPIIASLAALFTIDAFSYITGQISTYLGGKAHTFNYSNVATWQSATADFVPASFSHLQPPAKLINVVVYAPSLQALVVSQFLTEFTPAGPLITTAQNTSVKLDDGDAYVIVFYWLCILFAVTILILELRRITGLPQKCWFEEHTDKASIWTGFFLLVPILLIIAFAFKIKRMEFNLDLSALSSGDLSPVSTDPPESRVPSFLAKSEAYSWTASERQLFEVQNLIFYDTMNLTTNLLNFTVMVLLSVRYFLMYFPEMSATTMMVHRVVTPLTVTFFFLCCAMAFFGTMFYLILGDSVFEFRNWMSTLMSTVQFAHGGLKGWEDLHVNFAWSWWWLMLAAFLTFTVNLNNFAIAVLISHKKEAELHRNYSSHPFWQIMHRNHMQKGSEHKMNPALVGWDYSSKDFNSKIGPTEVTEDPGLKL